MPAAERNAYRVHIEPNQGGKYEVRLDACFGRREFGLGVFYLASTPERVAAHLAEVLRYLQRHEQDLWMWGSNASDRGLMFREFLREAGVQHDRRAEVPAPTLILSARPGQTARLLSARLKRKLVHLLESRPRAARARAVPKHRDVEVYA